jgi:hypothetical protein
MEELLRNVTISTLGLRNTTTLSLVFIVIGVVALFRNGEAAEVGGFLQLLRTTTGDELRVNQLAKQCTESGHGGLDEQSLKELKDLRVRFGELDRLGTKPRMAFGTEDELVPLVS